MEDKDPDSNDEEIKSLSPTFDLISEELLEKWEKILKSNNLIKARTITSDINFDDYNLNYESIQTIQNDSRRTRVRERFNFIDFESVLQKILVYFCKLNDVEYKQGLNEVLGPFLLLKVKIPKLKLSYIYNLFTLFIDYFFSNYYYESELFSFRSSISLVNLLLKYHDPTLYTLFKENNISPEMYAINWLLTTYANKNSLEITYTLWNTMLEENDQLFMHFMVISFLLYHKHKFIETDGSSIPVFFSKNQIATKEMLTEIVKGAREIRKNTPISFRILVRNLEIFKSRTTRVKEMYEKYNPEQILAMPVLAEELLGNMNSKKKIIPCPNDKCDNFFINEEKVNNEVITSNPCEICKIHNFKESLKYIIIDLRNKNDSQIKDSIINEGTLIFINNDLLPQEIINKGNAGEKLAEQIDKLKNSNNKIHVVLMTNDTDDYDEFEYKYQDTEGDSKKNKINNILSNTINKIKKKLDEQMTKKELKAEKYQQIKVQLRQYELIKSILLYLIEQEYPYISYILGGYKSIHDLCLKYNIPIIKHKANNCYMCMNKSLEENKNDRNEPSYKIINKQRNYNINVVRRYSDNFIRKKSEASIDKNKSNLKDQILEEIPVDKMNEHLTNKNNIIFHCLLVWHNMNDINEKVIIIIYEKSINIYKMNVKKEGIFFDVIEKIENECIKDVKRDKNVFNLYYKKNDKNYDIKIDTFTDNDGEAFYKIINNILNKIKEENNDNEKNNQ
jgi:hypothetical protein